MASPQSKPSIPGISDLFTRTWDTYRRKFWTLITIGIIAALLLVVFGFFFALIGDIRRFAPGTLIYAGFLVINFIAVLIVITLTIWSTASLIVAIRGSEESLGAVGAVAAFKQSWKYVFKFFWVSVLTALAVFGGFILLVIPGIYMGIILSLAPIIIIAEFKDVSIISALKKSHFYIKGYGWQTLGRFLILLLLLIAFGLALGVVLFLPLSILAAIIPQLSAFFRSLGNTTADIILTPFTTIYWILIYEDLKKAKQSTELS